MQSVEGIAETEQDLVRFGACLAKLAGKGGLITLQGALGAGKTTLVRGLIQAAGHTGAVKSPTFSLVEPYALDCGTIYHFDLYRLQDPEELEYIGIRDYLDQSSLCLVEWPEKAGNFLPDGDLNIIIEIVEKGRKVRLQSITDRGQALLENLMLAECWNGNTHRNGQAINQNQI